MKVKAMWYHLSHTWKNSIEHINPRLIDREDDIHEACICVAPSIEQCLIAIGDWRLMDKLFVYMTNGIPNPALDIFDYDVTHEHRFYFKKTFQRLYELDISKLSCQLPERLTCGISDEKILENIKLDLLDLKSLDISIFREI